MPDTDILTIDGTDYKIHDSDGRALVAPEELTSTAAAPHAIGEPFVYDGKLYRATDAISIGDPIVTTGTGANCEEVPGGLGGEVGYLKSAVDFSLLPYILAASNFSQGSLSTVTGNATSNSTKIRTGYIKAKIAAVKAVSGYKVGVFVYDASDVYMGTVIGRKLKKSTGENASRTERIDLQWLDPTYKIRIIVGNADGSDITVSDGYDKVILYTPTNMAVGPTEMTSTATEPHETGTDFVFNNKLYKATSHIDADGAIITTGENANCVEVPDGLCGEVTDLRFASNQLKDLHGLVDYNNKTPYHKIYDSSSTYTGYIDRSGIRFVFNGAFTQSSSTNAKVIVNNPIEPIIFTSSVTPTSATYALKLTNGHVYRARMREISGEKTDKVTIRINKAGTISVTGNAYTDKLSGDSICDFTYNSDTYPDGINIIVLITRMSTGNTLTNYTVDITLEDITDGTNYQIYTDVAPAELETATENHAVGDLIICKNQLYEVTAAIAAGETITPGTNVSATTIAAQLAAIKAQLANI